MSPRIRVMIVDDHPMARVGMRHFLAAYPEFELAAECGSGEEALQRFIEVQPDVVLLDQQLPGYDGITTTRMLRRLSPSLCILIVTSTADRALANRAIHAGARGYLLKQMDAADLAQAVRQAYAGQIVLANKLQAMDGTAPVIDQHSTQDLTEREREVLQLLVKGLPNRDIANQLAITTATVKFHINNIFTKHGVTTRAAMIALAYQRGLADGD